jgi:hypothetical protein
MTHPYLAAGLAREHERDLRAAAARARLAAIANCCRPSRLLRAARTIGPRFERPSATPCCS